MKVRVPISRPVDVIAMLMLMAVLLGCPLAAHTLGRTSSAREYERIATEAVAEAARALDTAEAAADAASYWQARATDASMTIDTLRAHAEEQSATIALLERRAADATGTIETLPAQVP